MADEEKPMNRRSFFRDGLLQMLKPLEKRIAPIERAAKQFSEFTETMTPKPGAKPLDQAHLIDPATSDVPRTLPLQIWLRPPGALAEEKFVETCTACGHCVSVCPASAIRLDEFGVQGRGKPYVDPDFQACVVCDGLFCMRECPSGALGYLPRWLIDMGTAVWNADLCLRRNGDECTTCIDQCPLGSEAIELRGNDIHVKEHGCVGCGVCQYYCPTYPKSIVVQPKAEKLQHEEAK